MLYYKHHVYEKHDWINLRLEWINIRNFIIFFFFNGLKVA
jgi:hypothetical protein